MTLKKFLLGIFLLFGHVLWFYLLIRFPDFILFITLIPIVVIFNLVRNQNIRNTYISIFVVLWMVFFQYESLRGFYFNQHLKKDFPKTKFLFPPAGWIMFYAVEPEAGYYEVVGIKGKDRIVIDPHEIFRVRTIGYDNIHRGILGTAYNPRNPHVSTTFCRYLNSRFPEFDRFYFKGYFYPNIIEKPYERVQRILYQCDDTHVRF